MDTPTVPASVLETVRGVDGVDVAVGSIVDESAAKILDRDGEAISGNGSPTFGFGIDSSPKSRFNPLKLIEGRWASGADEVVIDVRTADDEDYGGRRHGPRRDVGPVQGFEVVGIAQYGDVESLGQATSPSSTSRRRSACSTGAKA